MVKSGNFVLNLQPKFCRVELFGSYDVKVDNKGRLLLPSTLRRQVHDFLPEGFILKKNIFEQCIDLYPMRVWRKEMEKINTLNKFVKKNNDFIRLFMAGVRMVEIDDAGRLLIPRDLLLWCGIEHEVVLVSLVDKIEIWSKARYEQYVQEKANNFSQIAEEVMGQMKNDQ